MGYHGASIPKTCGANLTQINRPFDEELELLEGTLDCVFLLDSRWRFTYLNRRATAEIASGRNLVGLHFWDEFAAARGTQFEASYQRAMCERAHTNFETYFPPFASWYEVQAIPLSSGGIGVWFRNINKRKNANQALAAAEEKFRVVASAATDLVMEWDLITDEVKWESAVGAELGYTDECRSFAWCADRVHPDDRALFQEEIAAAIDQHRRLDCEARFLRFDGNYAHFHYRGVFLRSPNGRPVRMICAMQDVTERNRSNEKLRQREAQLANIFGQALVGIMESGPDGRLTLVNARFCEILGRTAQELQDCNVRDYTHPDDLIWNIPLLEANTRTGEPFQIEKRYIRPDGSVVWCRVSISFVLDAAGKIQSSIIVAEDISERKRTEADLKASEVMYRSVLEASADCIKIIDLDGRLELMNTPGLRIMEIRDLSNIKGTEWTSLWPAESRPLVTHAHAEAKAGRTSRFSAFCPTAAGTPKWWDVMVSPMFEDGGAVSKILSISRDITDQRDIAAKAKWASEHDSLTGLANRRAFETHLQAAIFRAMNGASQVGLLLVDLDHFKHVNDTLGHSAGDHFLIEFGARLKQCVRTGDFVARLGGDEFAVILEGGDAKLDLLAAGQSILNRLQKPIMYNGRVMAAGASMGGAVFPIDAASANELFNHADIALYALKESGRGGTRMFHQGMREQAQLVSSQLSLARSGITEKSIEPHYQQKIDLVSGRIIGFEALLRWRHARWGIQNPDSIAEAFKDYELASRIGDLMQRRVFTDMRGWLDDDVNVGSVAINAAPVEFLRDDFAERILARMQEQRIPPHLVEVEVTEHVFLERGSDFVGRALQVLARAGVRIALDDFGTGYSSLSHLRDYPVDVVKIDRSFIERMTNDDEVAAIVCAVIDLAKSLHIQVVAEGIETEAQRKMLISQGCGMGQGYLFGKAIAASKIPSLVA